VEFYEQCRREGALLHLVVAGRADDGYLGEAMIAPGTRHKPISPTSCSPGARGRGIAAEALRVLTDWAFATLGLRRAQVFVAPENVAALRLAERAGFRREGVLRSYWEGGGARLDAVVLSRLPGDPL